MKRLYRTGFLISTVALLALIGCEEPVSNPAAPAAPPPKELEHAKRWWNVLDGGQRVRALHGAEATEEEKSAAQKEYGALDADTKGKVNALAQDLYGKHGSVGAWWQKLSCKQKRIAVGDGNTDDPASPYCAEYPAAS